MLVKELSVFFILSNPLTIFNLLFLYHNSLVIIKTVLMIHKYLNKRKIFIRFNVQIQWKKEFL